MSRMRGYQTQVQQDVYQAWAVGNRVVMGVLPTGAGKTILMANTIRQHAGCSLMMAHRGQLVGQISQALARESVVHNIIGPSPLIKTIVDAHMDEFGKTFFNASAKCSVASVDTLARRNVGSFAQQVTLGMMDECFPAGTLVDGVPIETLSIGDEVVAFDDATGEFSKRKIVRTFKNPIPASLVVICTARATLKCTGGHPFWTQRGWVNAIDLTTDDKVLEYGHEVHELRDNVHNQCGTSTVSVSEDRQYFLHEEVWDGAQGRQAGSKEEGAGGAAVRQLQKTIYGRRMEDHLYDAVLRSSVRDQAQGDGVVNHDEQYESKICCGKDAPQQPDEQRCHPHKSIGNAESDRVRTDDSWWQWSWSHTLRKAVVWLSARARICVAIRGENKQASRMPKPLQNRSCASHIENCSGVGRVIPRVEGAPTAGREEGQFSRWVRLESVSIQKPTSADGAFVYNVEVAGLHTYVANGIVTHNCHHTLADNKWGRCVEMFPNAKWLMVTATPKRADGRGLGRHASGLIDTMCVGPTMRELIDWGFLTDYTVRWVQPSDLDLEGIRLSNATGDYNQDEVTARVKHSGMIIGNIVDTYCKHTMNKLAVCFAVDIEHAHDIAKRFNERNVAAEVISADTPEAERRAMLKRFKNRQTLVLVNVDLFGEGFDLPAIEVVIFGRPTASLALFIQQFGRVLRLMISPIHMAAWDTYTVEQRKRIIAESGKPFGMVHDHVGNIAHFGGAPDMFTDWTLDDAPKKASKSAADAIPLRPCLNCQMPYMRMYPACPFCGWEPPLPEARGIKEVDGDLSLLTSDQLRELLGAKQAFYSDPKIPYGASFQVEAGIRNMHANKMHNQAMLQDVMKLVMPPLYDERTNNRKFYLQYGIDTLTAQTLPSADATKLRERILESLRK